MELRRKYLGLKNNSERTMRKLLDAVGEIIVRNGYSGLTVTKVAERAGLRKSQIYHHFGSFENLVETYIREKDYWVGFSQKVTELVKEQRGNYGTELFECILTNQLDYFFGNREMQQVILWQLSEKNPTLFTIGEVREQLGDRLFQLTDPNFEGTDVDIRAVTALLVAGIYHLVLHCQYNDSLFCGIDIRTEHGMERIKKAISLVVSNTYETAQSQKKKHPKAKV